MAQLGGRSIRTLVTSLEALSDDGQFVLMFDTSGETGTVVKTRRPWESTWGSELPTFTLDRRSSQMLAKVLTGDDASYQRVDLEGIATSDFRGENPDTSAAAEAQAKADYEARCTELDIERARAANIQQEFILDHSRDKHVTGDVPGCPSCEAKVIPSVMPERDPGLDSIGDDDAEDIPF